MVKLSGSDALSVTSNSKLPKPSLKMGIAKAFGHYTFDVKLDFLCQHLYLAFMVNWNQEHILARLFYALLYIYLIFY